MIDCQPSTPNTSFLKHTILSSLGVGSNRRLTFHADAGALHLVVKDRDSDGLVGRIVPSNLELAKISNVTGLSINKSIKVL